MSRGEKRYGFDVRGYNPVYVSSVEHGQHTSVYIYMRGIHSIEVTTMT